MDAAHLSSIPLFHDLGKQDLERIARLADVVDLPAGYHLLDQGRFPHEFMIIDRGEVEVTVDGESVATLGPGDIVGEIALVQHIKRTASVIARTPVSAIVMATREFDTMCATVPVVAERIDATMQQRLSG